MIHSRRRIAAFAAAAVLGATLMSASPAFGTPYADFYDRNCGTTLWAGIYGTTTKYTEHEHTSSASGVTTTYAYSGNSTPVYHYSAKYHAFSHAAINTLNGTVTGSGSTCQL
jgi:hypothetical protein